MRRVAECCSKTIEARVIGQLVFEILSVQPAHRSDALRSGAKGPLEHRSLGQAPDVDGNGAQRTIADGQQRLGVMGAALTIEFRRVALLASLRSDVLLPKAGGQQILTRASRLRRLRSRRRRCRWRREFRALCDTPLQRLLCGPSACIALPDGSVAWLGRERVLLPSLILAALRDSAFDLSGPRRAANAHRHSMDRSDRAPVKGLGFTRVLVRTRDFT